MGNAIALTVFVSHSANRNRPEKVKGKKPLVILQKQSIEQRKSMLKSGHVSINEKGVLIVEAIVMNRYYVKIEAFGLCVVEPSTVMFIGHELKRELI